MKKGLVTIVIIIINIFMLFTLLACGEEVITTQSLSASEIINNSIDKMNVISSFHFELVHEGGRTPIAMGLELDKAIGDVTKPDKLKASITAALGGMLVKVEVVTIGITTYMTNPLTKEWELVPGEFSAISILDPNAGITAILEDIVDPSVVEGEDKDEGGSYHIKGEIPSKSLRPITLSSVEGVNVTVDVWIDAETFLIYQIQVEGQITETEKLGIIRILKLSNYNQEVEIESPI
ncbi:MAG TPA: LppX_LprAFG lipoprotein [Dehalococcoidia bacterium]|nr:LppX_LprAFG lipoprotein [Dehalococcoidia bacterium]